MKLPWFRTKKIRKNPDSGKKPDFVCPFLDFWPTILNIFLLSLVFPSP